MKFSFPFQISVETPAPARCRPELVGVVECVAPPQDAPPTNRTMTTTPILAPEEEVEVVVAMEEVVGAAEEEEEQIWMRTKLTTICWIT